MSLTQRHATRGAAQEHDQGMTAAHEATEATGSSGAAAALLIPSVAAFKALVAVPLLLWWACIAAGMAAHQGRPDGKFSHPLAWFDSLLFKRAGDLIPMAVLLLRLVAAALSGGASGSSGALKGAAVPSLWPGCAKLYAGLVALRLLVYGLHLLTHHAALLSYHLVSDHMLLAGMVMALLQLEAACVVGDLCRMGVAEGAAQQQGGRAAQQRRAAEEQLLPASGQEVVLAAALLLACLLMVCTAGNMYFTARFFHQPIECFATAVLAFGLFQLPALHWLYRSRVAAL
jgi:hypothetical protein